MDAVLLFALPVVGGLFFCNAWNFTRDRISREDGQRLYFRAIFGGAIIFVLVLMGRLLLRRYCPYYERSEAVVISALIPLAKGSNPQIADTAITSFLAMLLGAPAAWFLNLGFKRAFWLRRAINQHVFEAFLLDSSDRKFLIAVTLEDGKVYVGHVVEGIGVGTIGPDEQKFISVLPLMSGYRDKQTHTVMFTTFYLELYGKGNMATATGKAEPLPAPLDHLRATDFVTVLPRDRIVSCRLFDPKAYLEFQKRATAKPLAQDTALTSKTVNP